MFFFVKTSRTTARSWDVLMLLWSFVVASPHHRCSILTVAWDLVAVDELFGRLALGENCTDVHLARLIAGVQKAGLDVHDVSPASGSWRL